MQYVNFVYEGADNSTLHTGPVADSDAAYLRQAAKHFKTLTDDEYMTGLAGILHTMAKYSYVLDRQDVY